MLRAIGTRESLWDAMKTELNRESSFGLRTVHGWPNIRCCDWEKEWQSNIFSENDLRSIKPNTPNFIIAQTGSGKTTLVFDKIIPIAKREKKKVLYFAGRKALVQQMKLRAIRDKQNGEARGDVIRVKKMEEEYPSALLDKTYNFGNIDIFSYQQMLWKFDYIDFNCYSFAIFDETHFFISDATFNRYTEEIFDRILSKTSKLRRIYLTATPSEVLDTVYQKELKIFDNYPMKDACSLNVHVMREDYSFANCIFFSEENELFQLIKNTAADDNWLIFVRNKEYGSALKKKLEQIGKSVTFFSAETDRSDEEYQTLLQNESLPTQIVVTTKVLDIGINVRTKNMKIVLFEENITEAKQMIGRKRLGKNEEIEIYFYLPSFAEINKRKGMISQRIKDEKGIISSFYSKDPVIYHDELPHPMFYRSDGCLGYNRLSLKKLVKDLDYYESLSNSLSLYQNDEKEYDAHYKELMLSNFPRIRTDFEFNSEDSEEEDIKKGILDLILKWKDQNMDEKLWKEFLTELTKINGDDRADTRPQRDLMGTITVNKILRKYGFVVGKTKGIYSIKKEIGGNNNGK